VVRILNPTGLWHTPQRATTLGRSRPSGGQWRDPGLHGDRRQVVGAGAVAPLAADRGVGEFRSPAIARRAGDPGVAGEAAAHVVIREGLAKTSRAGLGRRGLASNNVPASLGLIERETYSARDREGLNPLKIQY
jgi:hypothetical protein